MATLESHNLKEFYLKYIPVLKLLSQRASVLMFGLTFQLRCLNFNLLFKANSTISRLSLPVKPAYTHLFGDKGTKNCGC